MDLNAVTSARPYHDKLARLAAPMDRDLRDRPPEVLASLIELLSAPGDVDIGAVTIALQKLDVSEASLADAVYHDAAAYVRTLLYRDGRAELLVLTWGPGQRSPVHDHGPSAGLTRIVSGEATERLYRRREQGASKREHMTRILRPGTVTNTLAETLHAISNESDAPLVTLHLYTPPLSHHG